MIGGAGPAESDATARARVLLIDDAARIARRLQRALVGRGVGRVWLHSERAPELAVALLAGSEFDLIVLALPGTPSRAARAVHAIAETALGTPLLLVESDDARANALERIPPSVIGCVGDDDMEAVLAAIVLGGGRRTIVSIAVALADTLPAAA